MRKIILILLISLSLLPFSAWAVDTLQAATASKADPVYNIDNWKMQFFYFNKADGRIFPPKPNGMGWTINFANPFSVGMFVLLLVGIYLILGRRKQRKGQNMMGDLNR